MGKSTSEWQADLIKTAQPHVGEPIVSIGMFTPKGATASSVLMFISPLASMLKRRSDRTSAGHLPDIGLYALTETSLHALDAKPKGRTWKVKEVARVFERATLRASAGQGAATNQLVLMDANGETYTLENIKLMDKGFNDQLIALLTSKPTDRQGAWPDAAR